MGMPTKVEKAIYLGLRSFPAQVHDPRDAVAQRVVLISALLEQDMRKSRVRISPWVSLYTFLLLLLKPLFLQVRQAEPR